MQIQVLKNYFSNPTNTFGVSLGRGPRGNVRLKTSGFVFKEGEEIEVDLEECPKEDTKFGVQYLLNRNTNLRRFNTPVSSNSETVEFKNKTLKSFEFPKIKDYCPEEGIKTIWGYWTDTEGNRYNGTVDPSKFRANAVFSVVGEKKEHPQYGWQITVSSIEIREFDLNKPAYLLKNIGFPPGAIEWGLNSGLLDLIYDETKSAREIIEFIEDAKRNKAIKGIGPKKINAIIDGIERIRTEQGSESTFDEEKALKAAVEDIFAKYQIAEFVNKNRAQRDKYLNDIYIGFQKLLEGQLAEYLSVKYNVESMEDIPKAIENNPYIMILLPNRGFKTVDSIARQMNVEIGSLFRQEACISSILDGHMSGGFASSGDIYLDREALYNELVNALSIDDEEGFYKQFSKEDSDLLFQKLREEGNSQFFSWIELDDQGGVTEKFTNAANRENEYDIFEKIQQAVANKPKTPIFSDLAIEEWISKFEKRQGENYSLSEEQREAIRIINSNEQSIFCMTGFAGTGKSTVSKAILELLKIELGMIYGDTDGIECIAVSGMASRRITEATGFKSSTVMSYGYNPRRIQGTRVLFIDEASMIDSQTMKDLLNKIDMTKVKVILVGDVGQLPPIGRGTPFKDILESGWVKTVSLQKIFRQSEDAVLTTFAKKMREEDIPTSMFDRSYEDFDFIRIPDDRLYKLRKEVSTLNNIENPTPAQRKTLREKKALIGVELEEHNRIAQNQIVSLLHKYKAEFIKDFTSFQLISPQKTTLVGTEQLNTLSQDILNDNDPFLDEVLDFGYAKEHKRFKLGDKVIHTKNENWEVGLELGFYIDGFFTKEGEKFKELKEEYSFKAGSKRVIRILNGMVGTIEHFDEVRRIILVKYRYEDIEIGVEYEFSRLNILHLGYCLTVHKLQGSEAKTVVFVISPSHTQMVDNNLLYTGITRGKKKGYMVGSEKAFKQGIKKHGSHRETMLPYLFEGILWELEDIEDKLCVFEEDEWQHDNSKVSDKLMVACRQDKFGNWKVEVTGGSLESKDKQESIKPKLSKETEMPVKAPKQTNPVVKPVEDWF